MVAENDDFVLHARQVDETEACADRNNYKDPCETTNTDTNAAGQSCMGTLLIVVMVLQGMFWT